MYLPSNQIEVFPAVLRDDQHQVESRFIDVEDVKRFHRFTFGGENIVLSTLEEVWNDSVLEMLIDGCYIKVTDIYESMAEIYDGVHPVHIYAEIYTDDEGIIGRDEDGKYLGVRFVSVANNETYTPPQGAKVLYIGYADIMQEIPFILNNQVVIDGGDK